MSLFSFNSLLLLAAAVAAYYAHAAYLKLEHARRTKQFALDQRRRAGIPDHDTRPFGIARADALKRQHKRDNPAVRHPPSSPLTPTAAATASPASRTYARHSPVKLASSLDSSLSQPGYLRRGNTNALRTPAAASDDEPRWPGAFREYPSPHAHNLYPDAHLVASPSALEGPASWSSPATRKHGLSDSESFSGSSGAARPKKTKADTAHANLERRAIAARTSKKRGPTEARDGVEDSVAGDRIVKRRNKAPLQELYDNSSLEAASYDEDEDEGGEEIEVGGDSSLDPDDDEQMDSAVSLSVSQRDRRGKKRDVDEVDGAESIAGASTRVVRNRKRGKAHRTSLPASLLPPDEREYQLEDEEMASLSDFGAGRIETDRESLALAPTLPRTVKGKRKVDTSDDREPGDEWTDLNGLRWRIGEDGVRRRATVVVEQRPKYNMPKDSQHPDAKQKIQVYVERFLSEEEYEEAKRKKLLGFQEAERQREAEAKRKAEEEAAAKAAEEAAAGRNVSTPKKLRNNDLLYSDSVVRHSPLRTSRSEVQLRGTADSPLRQSSTPLREGTPSSTSKANKRISLSIPNSNAASIVRASTPSRRSGLDEAGKRKREEALFKKLREEKEAKEAASQPKAAVAATSALTAAPAAAAPSTASTPASNRFSTPSATAAKSDSTPAAEKKDVPVLFGALTSAASAPSKPAEDAATKPSFSFGSQPAVSTTSTAAVSKPTGGETKPPFSFETPAAAAAAPSTLAATTTPSASEADAKPKTFGGFASGGTATPAAPESKNETKPAAATLGGGFSFGVPSTAKTTVDTETKPAGTKPAASLTGGFSFSHTTSKTDAKPVSSAGGYSFGASTTKPNPAPISTPAATESKPEAKPASAAAFSFGAPSAQPKTGSAPAPAPASSGGFTFGAPVASPATTDGSKTPATFSFGVGAAKLETNPTGAPASTFSFGTSSAAKTGGVSTPSFSFGGATRTPAPAAAAGGKSATPAPFSFSFGSTANTGSGGGGETKPSTGAAAFSFGTPATTTGAADKTPGTFSFGTPSATGASGGFTFGNSVNTGAGKDTNQSGASSATAPAGGFTFSIGKK
ncbi:hypothetical protein ACQY0O_004218 [Thecaphora frezii]